MDYSDVAVVVLAAGKGSRMGNILINKTALAVSDGRPMISKAIETIVAVGCKQIITVVGHKAETVKDALKQYAVNYAEQTEQLGTAHAVECALDQLESTVTYVVVVNGDDSSRYKPEVYFEMIKKIKETNAGLVLLTLHKDNPTGLGRITRNANGLITGIVEEASATEEEKKIKEINTGCYCFNAHFLKQHIGDVMFNAIKHERYLTDMVTIAIAHDVAVETVVLNDEALWHGVNTPNDLADL